MNQVLVSGKVVFLSGGAGGLARSLADLVLTRGGSVWLGDLDQSAVEKVVDTLREKHDAGRVGGGQLDVRAGEGWQAAWQVSLSSPGLSWPLTAHFTCRAVLTVSGPRTSSSTSPG